MPRTWFTGALHRAGSLLPFSPGSCWQRRQALSANPEPPPGSISGDGCAAKSEKRRKGAARVRVWVCLPGCGCLSAPGQTQRGLPAAQRLRGKERSRPARGEAAGRGRPAARARPATGGQYVPAAGRFTCSGRRPLTVPDSLQHLLPQRSKKKKKKLIN